MRSSTPPVPGPRGAFLTGSALELRHDVLGVYERGRREHGDAVRFVVGPPGGRKIFYALFHPDAVRHVLQAEADNYRKDSRFYQEVRWPSATGC